MDLANQWPRCQIAGCVVRFCAITALSYFTAKWIISRVDPLNQMKNRIKQKAAKQLKKLNKRNSSGKELKLGDLNEHEMAIAAHLVAPEDINIGWRDIAGLHKIKEEVRDSLILPLMHQELYKQSRLFSTPKGVLLYGPPGCGKTLIAKAVATETQMRFINLDVSMLTDKWYGESQKLAKAVFTLAQKMQPCIIFIDEIDSFLRARGNSDHEATAMMKTQFMMLWDGLRTATNSTIIVLGATNRPQDIDMAILRRMPLQLHIGAPNKAERLDILRLILKREKVNSSVDLRHLAKSTDGFSGSDLRELCRSAMVSHMKHVMDEQIGAGDAKQILPFKFDACDLSLNVEDFEKSLAKLKKSKQVLLSKAESVTYGEEY
ncbi:ATPase family AAA domain-containing protein 1-B [Scaptodrosophila lebanonensis]|uniref:ATPase family AAA domain-containing protein 1-B n=1 Tax=Drosophila lebanonensis TaxID=7225 RepID=A0A6J2TRH4_DROLE|nr:ATPase family AAA domain-containing protein 1-B [Scaptodrosophila lebanonensis]